MLKIFQLLLWSVSSSVLFTLLILKKDQYIAANFSLWFIFHFIWMLNEDSETETETETES